LVAVLVVAAVVACFCLGFLFPPPAAPPNLQNVAWQSDSGAFQKTLAGVYLGTRNWEILDCGIVKFAEDKDASHRIMIGMAGQWYGL